MESEAFIEIVLFFVLLLLSAFFSGSEMAYFSLSQSTLNRLKEKDSKNAGRVIQLLEKPQQLLITILTGNTIVIVAAATIAALFIADICHQFNFDKEIGVLLEVVVVTLVILILSEILPKVLAVKNTELFSQRVSLPLTWVSNVLFPITIVLSQFTRFISQKIGIPEKGVFLSEEELKTLVQVGEGKRALEEEEKEMIHSIFEFSETQVHEIMVPRIDMVCAEKNATIEELIDIIREKGHTRIPLYEEVVDNILGIIHAKDLLPYLNIKSEKVDLAPLARPAYFVPESKKIDELLREFQREKTHMAIVVDEYGGTSGLITLEDVIEEIVGEIQDEHDAEFPLYKKIDENTLLVNAKIDIDELNKLLEIQLPTEEGYESLGGFIFNLTGYVPTEKEVVKYNGYNFVIEKIERNRIIQVRIAKEDVSSDLGVNFEREEG